MSLLRRIVVLLIALAVATAPLGAALAGPHVTQHGATDQSTAPLAPHDMSGMAAMADCEKMMGKSGSTDCPCCDIDHACPPLFCMAKCFQFLGLAHQSRPLPKLVTTTFSPSAPAHPPDWSDQPQTPPPRT